MNVLMDRRSFIRAAGAGVLGVLLLRKARAERAEARPSTKPNVVLIIADDLGYGEVSCYPQQDAIRTPNIDRLARDGIRMIQGYSADPMCLPSRASLLTGKYHQRIRSLRRIPESTRTVGQYLQEAGYVTGCIGKWHNCVPGTDLEHGPLASGFDEFFGFLGGMHDYFEADKGFQTGKGWIYMPIYDGTTPVKRVKYLTDEFTDRAVNFITRHKDRSFFLYVPYTAKHTPLQVTDEYLKRSSDVNSAMIDSLDTGVGRICDTLREHGLYENTLVFFIGDNGGSPGPNWHLRGKKQRLFEGGIRIPFIVRWPKGLPASETYHAPVMHMDVAPTILAAIGVEAGEYADMDGKNLLPYWRRERTAAPHETLFWGRTDASRYAVRRNQWKLVRDSDSKEGQPELSLYNLNVDSAEQRNVLEENKQIADELSHLYRYWCTSCAKSKRSK